MNNVAVRIYWSDDKDLIFNTWYEGMKNSTQFLKAFSHYDEISFKVFFSKWLDQFLFNPRVEIKVACMDDDRKIILGYSILERNVIHWIFVKYSFRKLGIGKLLVPEYVKYCTNLTQLGSILAKSHNIEYQPLILEDK